MATNQRNIHSIEVYDDRRKESRWRMKRSGETIADGAEGIKERRKMLRTLERFIGATHVRIKGLTPKPILAELGKPIDLQQYAKRNVPGR